MSKQEVINKFERETVASGDWEIYYLMRQWIRQLKSELV